VATTRANPGRVAAALALLAVERGAHVEDELATKAPAGQDRALAWFLALGVLRRRAELDAALRPHLKQPVTGLDAEVRVILRLAAFERLFARTATHAAVDQAVELTRALGVGRASGLVNAVSRKIRMPKDLSAADALNHPAWLLARWEARYGVEAAHSWCRSNNEPPPLFIVSRDDDVAIPGAEPTALRGVWRLPEIVGPVTDLPQWSAGRLWVQDFAAVQVADAAGDVRGKRVLDACAAPGGKSFRLASHGALVTAVDREDRLPLIRDAAARLGFELETAAHDWEEGPHATLGAFDVVLVDAPCSGLGTVRRHPAIRWRRQLVDVLAIPARQGAILAAAATHVAPGGRLVYAVCSAEPEEGEGVVAAFLAEHPEFVRVSELSTAPPRHGEDAHFAVVMERR